VFTDHFETQVEPHEVVVIKVVPEGGTRK